LIADEKERAAVIARNEKFAFYYKFAAQEGQIWNALKTAEQETNYYSLFSPSSRYELSVDVIDMDREDAAFLKHVKTIYFSPFVASQNVQLRSANLLRPTADRRANKKWRNLVTDKFIADVVAREKKVSPEREKQIYRDTSYPSCFQSRHAQVYRRKALLFAAKHPDQFLVSNACKSIAGFADVQLEQPDVPMERKGENGKEQKHQPMDIQPDGKRGQAAAAAAAYDREIEEAQNAMLEDDSDYHFVRPEAATQAYPPSPPPPPPADDDDGGVDFTADDGFGLGGLPSPNQLAEPAVEIAVRGEGKEAKV